MSIASNIGAESAATEIKGVIDKEVKALEDNYVNAYSKKRVLEILKRIDAKAKDIIETAKAGYY